MFEDNAPANVAALVDLWAWIADLYKTLKSDVAHWEAHLAAPPPGDVPEFTHTVTRRLNEARADLEWLEEEIEPHLRRKGPPYPVREKWRRRTEGHLAGVMGDAIVAARVLITRVLKDEADPTHEEMVNVVRHVLGAIQFTHRGPPDELKIANTVSDDAFQAVMELANHDQVAAALRGDLDHVAGLEWSQYGSVNAAVAVFLWLAGVSLKPRKIYEEFVLK